MPAPDRWIALFLLPGQSWEDFRCPRAPDGTPYRDLEAPFIESTARLYSSVRQSFARRAGEKCGNCSRGLSSGRNHVLVTLMVVKSWLCRACALASDDQEVRQMARTLKRPSRRRRPLPSPHQRPLSAPA